MLSSTPSTRMLIATAMVTVCAHVAQTQTPATPTPAGFWQTISDVDGKPRALVEIREVDGKFVGVVKALLAESENPEKVCDKCSGERKGQRVVGMEILRGIRAEGNEWGGGEILDPNNGKTYKAKMRLGDGGKTLIVRGFIGFSLLGRSQTWHRAEAK